MNEASAGSSLHRFTHARQAFAVAAERNAERQALVASGPAPAPHKSDGAAAASSASASGRGDGNWRRNSITNCASPTSTRSKQITHRIAYERSTDGINWSALILANVPATTPAPQFQPYIGDYVGLEAVGQDFYGIFSAHNRPDPTRFPNGVKYQRNHDFDTRRLLARDGITPVAVSIDPFFFKITE